MKKLQIYISLLSVVISVHAFAQKTDFLSKGKITFEKRVNMYAQMQQMFKGENDSWVDDVKDYFKKNNSQFQIAQYVLYFDNNKTLYKNLPSEEVKQNIWFMYNDEDNSTYSDFAKEECIRERHVYEDFFLLTDSCRKISWKITNETREIAGINCRRANAIIMDSVYVVAFYADEIITPGGPESFNGLPGMILGVALPYDHVTWFATKIETDANAGKAIVPPTKGKKMNNKEYVEILTPALKNWGNRGKNIIKVTQY
ncbi:MULTISPECIES: GLPGLI family protein [Chitinophagaceae]